MVLTCQQCSQEFGSDRRSKKFCSLRCRNVSYIKNVGDCSIEFCSGLAKRSGMCLKHYTHEYRKTNERAYDIDQEFSNKLKYRYDISEDDYRLLWDVQNGLCAVCEKPLNYRAKGTHIDHDHATNEIRGLLCHPCNNRIVAALESPLLESALKYLSMPPARKL